MKDSKDQKLEKILKDSERFQKMMKDSNYQKIEIFQILHLTQAFSNMFNRSHYMMVKEALHFCANTYSTYTCPWQPRTQYVCGLFSSRPKK